MHKQFKYHLTLVLKFFYCGLLILKIYHHVLQFHLDR